ncbi:MAG: sulfoxide reductase heme-binding subunit YedZ [Betaproteobacteria bacterium]|nr:sulfoxide reductase heme-binding subunit YedZ [Betaproteobacteria bacterium]
MDGRKTAVFAAALIPFGRLVWMAARGTLGAHPVEHVIHFTGQWTLNFLLITLAVTPLRRLTGWREPLRHRRMLGLFAFFYGSLHLLSYAGLDQWFDWAAIGHDVAKHPYVLVGLLAYVTMLPLAATSNRWAVSRLKTRWKQLHRLAYVIPALGTLHFAWLVKKDLTEPLLYGAGLLILLAFRWPFAQNARQRLENPAP